QAVDVEARRQIGILEDGGKIDQETRLYDPAKGETRSMRSKEEAHDYRYFPDPDLLPLEFDQAFVEALRAQLPELPDAKKARLISQYGLSPYDASVLVAEREQADFFEAVAKGRDGKAAANWVINELFGRLNKENKDVTASPMSADQLGGIVDLIGEGVISGTIAKQLFEIIWTEAENDKTLDPRVVVEARGMKQVTDTGAIEKVIDEVIAANPDKVEQIKLKPSMAGWFVGQVMKASGGKASPAVVNELLARKLGLG
ncbi:MAG: Asp-tRNA(Asn)/Glu-tRNA(Gln) amidotransferase subunit GatB, partial [Bosea sp. (in: a-proteobacteria)]